MGNKDSNKNDNNMSCHRVIIKIGRVIKFNQ